MGEGPAAVPFSRRRFLAGSAAMALASALPGEFLSAQPPVKYLRRNLSDPSFPPRVLESYKKAISAMLALPPTDPRNWYRNAFTHTFDCPHGNWWFVVWHRGYTGWFERTCRELSGDPEFALPYWDWTAETRIPPAFFDGVLNPTNPAYIESLDAFESAFTAPMNAYWNSLSPAQLEQLRLRPYNSMAEVWAQVRDVPFFFPRPEARTLTAANPDLSGSTLVAVSIDTVNDALAPQTFIDFGSPKAAYHSAMAGFGILEGQPHNLVHNNVGGFMQDFLSPVDPIFFTHHGNIDRLWETWTRKQQNLGLPTLPTGTDLAEWEREPFLFFSDAAGLPVARNRAGDYATIGDFNYEYQPGSGDDVLKTSAATSAAFSKKSFKAALKGAALTLSQAATGSVTVPEALLQAASVKGGPTVFARVTLEPPADLRGFRLKLLVNPPTGAASLGVDSPHYAAAIEFFGRHHHVKGPVTFTVPLSRTLKALRGKSLLKANQALRIHLAAEAKGPAPKAFSAKVLTVSVGTF